MVRGINIVDARTSPCAIEDDANAVGLNLVEAKDALSWGGSVNRTVSRLCFLFFASYLCADFISAHK